ncbi:uncharacterized protein LOC102346938 isoform X2 [Latimeria chalumnae]|uniref:uncharacterized protein LOC102346938 isoform X2 n=1 Tax=Latimeria chalumnae TaxID=7897 RepID=UPI00313EBDCF
MELPALTAAPPVLQGDSLTLEALQLFIPPIQLSAVAIWYTVKKREVKRYGNVLEFLEVVNMAAPDLACCRHYAKLSMGLSAKMIMEMLRESSAPKEILNALESYSLKTVMNHPEASLRDKKKIGEAWKNLQQQVRLLLRDEKCRQRYLKEEFDLEYGEEFSAVLENLLWEYLVRLESTLPKISIKQLVSILDSMESSVLMDQEFLSTQLQKPALDAMRIMFQYFRKQGYLSADFCDEGQEDDFEAGFHTIFPACRRCKTSLDVNSEGLEICLDMELWGGDSPEKVECGVPDPPRQLLTRPGENAEMVTTENITPLEKELQIRCLMLQTFENVLPQNTVEGSFSLTGEETPKKLAQVTSPRSSNQSESGSSSEAKCRTEDWERKGWHLSPVLCDLYHEKRGSNLECLPSRRRLQTEFCTPVFKCGQVYTLEDRVMLRSQLEGAQSQSPVGGGCVSELIQKCLRYQPKVLLHSLDNLCSKSSEEENRAPQDRSEEKAAEQDSSYSNTSASSSDRGHGRWSRRTLNLWKQRCRHSGCYSHHKPDFRASYREKNPVRHVRRRITYAKRCLTEADLLKEELAEQKENQLEFYTENLLNSRLSELGSVSQNWFLNEQRQGVSAAIPEDKSEHIHPHTNRVSET